MESEGATSHGEGVSGGLLEEMTVRDLRNQKSVGVKEKGYRRPEIGGTTGPLRIKVVRVEDGGLISHRCQNL